MQCSCSSTYTALCIFQSYGLLEYGCYHHTVRPYHFQTTYYSPDTCTNSKVEELCSQARIISCCLQHVSNSESVVQGQVEDKSLCKNVVMSNPSHCMAGSRCCIEIDMSECSPSMHVVQLTLGLTDDHPVLWR